MGDVAQDRIGGWGNIALIGRIVDDRGMVRKVEPPPIDAASTDTDARRNNCRAITMIMSPKKQTSSRQFMRIEGLCSTHTCGHSG